MNYTLEKFLGDWRGALHEDDGPTGREQVRLSVKKALKDKTFISK